MKKIIAALLAALLLFSVTALAEEPWDEPDSYIATGGWINDQQSYYGAWAQTYMQILNNHYTPIHAYQNRKLEYYTGNNQYVQIPCKPVAISDITGDGIPELIFLETTNEYRGDLYIYSSDGSTTRCALFVPGISRLGYDDVGLGFDVYLASGGTLVIEYYEYEWPWVLQLQRNGLGQFTLLNYLRAKFDNSGEEEDRCYKNGIRISWNEYSSELQKLQNTKTFQLSTYSSYDTSHYGFSLDFESAVSMLNSYGASSGQNNQNQNQTPNQNTNGVYGLTIQKLATRKGPGTQYEEGGTYNVKDQWIKVLAKAWDKRNGIWWVKCEIPYHGEIRVLWTGWKRFDHSTISLDDLPEEQW